MPDPPLSFEQPAGSPLAGTALFAMPADGGPWCGYLLGRGDRAPGRPIDVEASFRDFDGHYLFALQAPPLATREDVDRLVDRTRSWLDASFGTSSPRRFDQRACVWIEDPARPAFGRPDASAFTFGWGLSGASLASDFNDHIGPRLTLSLLSGTRISATATGLRLTGAAGADGIRLTTTPTGRGPTVDPAVAQIPFAGPHRGTLLVGGRLPLATALPFFTAGLHYAHPDGKTNGAAAGAAGANGGTEASGAAGASGVARRRYPLLTEAGAPTLPYAGAIDPLDPLNRALPAGELAAGRLRTLLAPLAPGGAGPALASWLRTATGAAVRLAPLHGADGDGAPLPHAGALVFEATDGGDVVLGPAGDWAVVTGDAAPAELLCGLSGLERLVARPLAPTSVSGADAGQADAGEAGADEAGDVVASLADAPPFDRLRFVPSQPAYAPRFPFADVSQTDPARGGALLDATQRTSWATVVSGDAATVDYLAQPDSSPLFAPAQAAGGPGVSDEAPPAPLVLDWRATAQPLPDAAGFAVPFVPYAGLGAVAAEASAFETQVLAPARRARIAAPGLARHRALRAARHAARAGAAPGASTAPGTTAAGAAPGASAPGTTAAPAAAGTTLATTPQGFLVELAGDLYEHVTLARSASGPDLAFDQPPAELQSLLQTNQLFAVAVDPAHLGGFANAVDIAGWRMRADVGRGVTASDYRNVLVMKFCDGSLQERVASPQKWTDPDAFSVVAGTPPAGREQALTGLSQWLQQFVSDAVERARAGDTLYDDFARIATAPEWRGILVLNADVEPGDLPEQIRGLAAGIDFSQFLAHHFGTTVTPVVPQGGSIGIGGISSLFGLIDYELPVYRASVAAGASPDMPMPLSTADGAAYGFSVLQLQALFRNAALVDFRSRIQLTAGELFGSRVTAAHGAAGELPVGAVVLRGTYQRQGAEPSYVFEQDATTVFSLDSNVLSSVALRRVQFTTATTGGRDGGEIRSRFLMWGTLGFARLAGSDGQPFDVLSFGPAPDAPPAQRADGLAFSNLVLELASPAATPNAIAFTFDPSGLAFDLRASTARAGSLFPTFALQLDSFIASPADRRPADHGYLTVGVAPPQEALDGPWYGVVCDVTLGTPGALVAQAGFSSKLLLAWSPQTRAGDQTASFFAGLQLPGAAPGARLFSVQGVLKLSIDQLQLQHDEVAGQPGVRAFTLRMSNVGLKFLGIAKLPPGATIDFFLFGDPQGAGSLGWYAAYVADADRPQLARLEAGR